MDNISINRFFDFILYAILFVYQTFIVMRINRTEKDHEKIIRYGERFLRVEEKLNKIIKEHEDNH